MNKTTVIWMSIIENYLANIVLISCLNSFLVLIHNLIKTKGEYIDIKNISIEEQMYLSSIFFSLVFFIIDNIFLLIFKKEKILLEIILIIFFLIIINKFKKIRKILWINHILFDLTIPFKPILWYMVIKIMI